MCIWVLRQFAYAMMATVADANRCGGVKRLLKFQTPSLKLRRMCCSRRDCDCRWGEIGSYRLDLSEGLAAGKTIEKCCIRSGRILKEAGRFIRRAVVFCGRI